MRAGHAPTRIENPPRHASVIEAQCPLLAIGQIEKGELGTRGADQAILRADRAGISERRTIARQEQVIAIIDRHADAVVVVGAAAAARDSRRLMYNDGMAARRELDRSRQAGEAGAYDVDDPRHQAIA